MKKTKILFGAVLAIILALSCLAFTACDGTFNIDSQENIATDASLAAFMSGVAENSELDTETGLPSYIAGNSYSVEYSQTLKAETEMDIVGTTIKSKQDISTSVKGTVNIVKNMTGKLDMTMKLEQSTGGDAAGTTKMDVTAGMIVADGKIYADTKTYVSGGETSLNSDNKIAIDLSKLTDKIGDIGDFIPDTDEDTDVQLDDFIDEIKASFSDLEIFGGVTINPTVYIKDGAMKITLGDVGYVGIKFDKEWNLEAADVVAEIKVDNSTGSGTTKTEVKLRKTGAVSVSAPSDASSYKSGDISDIIGKVLG